MAAAPKKENKQNRETHLNVIFLGELNICYCGLSLKFTVMGLFTPKLELNYNGLANKTLTRYSDLGQSAPGSSHLE